MSEKGGGKERKKFDEVGGMGKKGKGGEKWAFPLLPTQSKPALFPFPSMLSAEKGSEHLFRLCEEERRTRGETT